MHLIGFIIRIYHDARSSECQISQKIVLVQVKSQNVYCHGLVLLIHRALPFHTIWYIIQKIFHMGMLWQIKEHMACIIAFV